MKKNCQNCKKDFEIEQEDFDFYEKIKVPPPTWCPQCRMIRRFFWRNERALYKRPCAVPGHTEEVISMYSPEEFVKTFDQKYWWTDGWDPLQYGQEYDLKVPFFTQFKKLLYQTPLSALQNVNSTNSEWCNPGVDNKNCYLSFAATKNENVSYSNRIASCRDSLDLYLGNKIELSSNSLFLENCTKVYYSMHSRNCVDSWFLYDCNNCSDCIGCVNLRNKQFHIFNKPYSREDYQKKKAELNLGSFSGLEKIKKEFNDFLSGQPHRHSHAVNTVNSTGDNLENVKNAKYCFDIVNGMENSKYCVWGGYGWKDSYDGLGCNGELMYELSDAGAVGRTCSNTYFSVAITNSIDVQYSHSIKGCSHVFGCVGLRDQQYCILNKQYTKEEYEALVPEIIKHMHAMPYKDSKGRIYEYGEFFPPEISPFAYNETIAQEYFPIEKETALEWGYKWRDKIERKYKIDITNENIPDNIENVGDEMLGKVLECAHKGTCHEQCTEAFKIIPQELQLYKALNLPLPRLCPNCRHYQRLGQRNPLDLWHRQCMCKNGNHPTHSGDKCSNEFETSYAPGRKEIIYCEKCYQQEVY